MNPYLVSYVPCGEPDPERQGVPEHKIQDGYKANFLNQHSTYSFIRKITVVSGENAQREIHMMGHITNALWEII